MRLRLRRICVLGVALALSLATMARAQFASEVQTGSRIPVKSKAIDPVLAGSVKKGFGLCVLHTMQDASAAIMNRGDPIRVDWQAVGTEPAKFFSHQAVKYCVGDQSNGVQSALGLKLTDSAFRAILMEEAYLQRFSDAPALPEGAQERVDRTYVSVGDDLPSAMGLGQFADCLTFRDTAHSDALLRTGPGTKGELSAAQAMAATLGACLVKGQTLALTPTNIRAIVADGLWTRYVRNSTPALAQGK